MGQSRTCRWTCDKKVSRTGRPKSCRKTKTQTFGGAKTQSGAKVSRRKQRITFTAPCPTGCGGMLQPGDTYRHCDRCEHFATDIDPFRQRRMNESPEKFCCCAW